MNSISTKTIEAAFDQMSRNKFEPTRPIVLPARLYDRCVEWYGPKWNTDGACVRANDGPIPSRRTRFASSRVIYFNTNS